VSARADHATLAGTRWRPTATVAASIGLHCAAGAATLVEPALWPWTVGGVAANHAFLGALGLWPRSTWLGPNWTRLPAASAARHEVALTFDDGPDPEITPRVLDLLDASGARGTFFCIALHARAQAALCREIVRRGHAVENHSYGHRSLSFPMLGLRGFRREVSQAQAAIADVTGRAPRFFRAPAGLRNPLLDPVLHELGLTLASWTRRAFDTRDDDAKRVTRRLLQGLAPGDILLLHDGQGARTAAGEHVVMAVLPQVLAAVRGTGCVPVTLRHAIER